MNQYPSGTHVSFHLVYGPSTTHEYHDYHMDLKDCLAVTFGLIGKVVHKGCQANVFAAKENVIGFYQEGQYSPRVFQAQG